MKKIKLLTGILSVMLFVALVPTLKTKAESLRGNDESDVVVDVTNWESQSVEMLADEGETEETTGHHTPNTALYLDSTYMGQVLADSATSEENWYYFQAGANRKIAALLEQPSDGDYDIILYKLNLDNGNLTAVAASGYGGNVIDRLSTVNDSDGYYFLQVLPAKASTATDAVYYFIINLIDAYDSNEPNDNPSQSNVYNSSNLNLTGTIDNVFDQDWAKITVTGTKNYQVELNNVPTDAQYAANIFDENLNVKSQVLSDGNKKTYASLSAGTYYICIASYNKYSASASYNFKLHEVHSLNSAFYTTKGGHQVEITDSGVYVDGTYVNLNWSVNYNINYTRIQNFTITSSTKVDASSYQNGTFIDGQNMNSSSDCIRVKINNFNMEYFCNSPYDSWDKHFGESSWTYFYIDANTGKTIGTDANYYHTNMGIRNRFSKF